MTAYCNIELEQSHMFLKCKNIETFEKKFVFFFLFWKERGREMERERNATDMNLNRKTVTFGIYQANLRNSSKKISLVFQFQLYN